MIRGRNFTREFSCKGTEKSEKGYKCGRHLDLLWGMVQQLRTYHKSVCHKHEWRHYLTSLHDIIEVSNQSACIQFKRAVETAPHQSARLIFFLLANSHLDSCLFH